MPAASTRARSAERERPTQTAPELTASVRAPRMGTRRTIVSGAGSIRTSSLPRAAITQTPAGDVGEAAGPELPVSELDALDDPPRRRIDADDGRVELARRPDKTVTGRDSARHRRHGDPVGHAIRARINTEKPIPEEVDRPQRAEASSEVDHGATWP